jgi:hypothetical protein
MNDNDATSAPSYNSHNDSHDSHDFRGVFASVVHSVNQEADRLESEHGSVPDVPYVEPAEVLPLQRNDIRGDRQNQLRVMTQEWTRRSQEIRERWERDEKEKREQERLLIISPPIISNTSMSFFESVLERVKAHSQTTMLGAIGAIAPLVVPVLGLPAPIVPVVYGAIALANALAAKRDVVSTAGMGGTILAQAFSALGVPMADWLVSGAAAFFGFFSKDQEDDRVRAVATE